MSAKPKLAMYWASACGGCDIALLNIHERLLDVDANFEIVFWPAVMDAKVKDVEAMADGSIYVTLFSGGMRNRENIEMAHLLRRKTQVLVACGSCATEGCIPGLANLSSKQALFDTAYHTLSTDNPNNTHPTPVTRVPEGEIRIPELEPLVRTLDQVVPVDYTLPGCPPESHQLTAIVEYLIQILRGRTHLPPKGTVLGAGSSTVCDDCPRTRNVKAIKQFVRIQDLAVIDTELCLLEQGLPCNGPATRSGCGSLCPRANAPCTGCYGAADGVVDFGARLMSAFASVIDSQDPAEIERIIAGIPDPAGQFYRFSLAKSLLRGAKSAVQAQ